MLNISCIMVYLLAQYADDIIYPSKMLMCILLPYYMLLHWLSIIYAVILFSIQYADILVILVYLIYHLSIQYSVILLFILVCWWYIIYQSYILICYIIILSNMLMLLLVSLMCANKLYISLYVVDKLCICSVCWCIMYESLFVNLC